MLFTATLALPLVGHVFGPRLEKSAVEGRLLAARPQLSLQALPQLARQADAYVRDHFGFRDQILQANAELRNLVRSSPSRNVVYGSNGTLFYTAEKVFEQSTGQVLRLAAMEAFADYLAELYAAARGKGTPFLVAFPPNNHTTNYENLPWWAPGKPALVEYDVILNNLKKRGVPFVDLRPVLEEGKRLGGVAQTADTHWSPLGSVLGYNAVVRALGRAEWAFDQGQDYRASAALHPGDLDRMAMRSSPLNRSNRARLPPADDRRLQVSYLANHVDVATRPNSGGNETVLVLGDSSTRSSFPAYFTYHVGRLVWAHHLGCRWFDKSVIDRYQPDYIVFMSTERTFCFAE